MSLFTSLKNTPPTRGLVSFALTETASVLSGTVVDDGGGGGTLTYEAGETIPCRIDPLGTGTREGETANRISDRSTDVVTLPANTAITTANELRIDGRGTFEVTAVRERSNELARFVEVVSRS